MRSITAARSAAGLLANPATVRYRLIEDLIHDLGIYYRGYWLKVRYQGADGRVLLLEGRLEGELLLLDRGAKVGLLLLDGG